ncbi:MAG: hypothetical protein AAF558_04900 [Verrucomicrobiota bacterium]
MFHKLTYLLIGALWIHCTHNAYSQILTFSFTGSGANRPTVNQPWTNTSSINSSLNLINGFRYGVIASNPNAAGNGLSTPQGGATDPNNALSARNWGGNSLSNALSSNDYLTFSIRADNGSVINLDGAAINLTLGRLNFGGPSNYAIFTSVNGFAASQAVDSGTLGSSGDYTPRVISFTLSGSQYNNLSGTVEFRIYAYNGNAQNGTLALTAFAIGSGSSVTTSGGGGPTETTPAYIGIRGENFSKIIGMGADAARIPFDMNKFSEAGNGQAGPYPFNDSDPNDDEDDGLDDDIEAYYSAGVTMIGSLSYCPTWANRNTWNQYGYTLTDPGNGFENHWCPPDNINVWKDMCRKVMEENLGKISHYEIWNEPGGHFFLPPGARPNDQNQDIGVVRELIREKYIPLCKAAYEAAQELNAIHGTNIRIFTIASHTDHLINTTEGSWTDWCFEEKLPDGTGILDYSDGLVMHIYPFPYQGSGAFDIQWVNWTNRIKEYYNANNVNLPIWVTEFGYQKNPDPVRYPFANDYEPAIVYAQHLQMLATAHQNKPMVEGLIKFRLEYTTPSDFDDNGWGVWDPSNNNELPGFAALEFLYGITANMETYSVIESATTSDPGDTFQPPGGDLPSLPNNRVHAVHIKHFDGTEYVFIGAWRMQYDPYAYNSEFGFENEPGDNFGPDPWQTYPWHWLDPFPSADDWDNTLGIGPKTVDLIIPGNFSDWTVQRVNENGTVSPYNGFTKQSQQIIFDDVFLFAPTDVESPAAKLLKPEGQFFLLTKPGNTEPPLMEAGEVQWTQSSGWKTVSLDGNYNDPIIVVGPVSYQGGDPCTIRVRNVESNSFQFQVDEWDYLDGNHGADETMGYVVMEAGEYTIGGRKWEAGKINSVNQNWTTQNFQRNDFDGNQTVLTQVTTINESSAVTVRMRNIDNDSFQIRLQEEQAGGNHAAETIHYIAVEAGSGTEQNMKFLSASSGNTVDEVWETVNFGTTINSPFILGQIATTNGGDPCALRYRSLTSSSAQFLVEEEKSSDTEVAHNNEEVRYLVIEGN